MICTRSNRHLDNGARAAAMSAPRGALAILAPMLLGISACGAVDDGTDPEIAVGSITHSIINGTPVDPELFGAVQVVTARAGSDPGEFCSGTLLTNEWVLTAKHCVAIGSTRPMSVTLGNQTVAVAERHWHERHDVALLRLRDPLLVNGRAWGHMANFWNGGDLYDRVMTCVGYGLRTQTQGAGVARSAEMRVAPRWVHELFYPDHLVAGGIAGQYPWRGDSGSSCFVRNAHGQRRLVGVASEAKGSRTYYVRHGAFRDWVSEILSSKQLVFRSSGKALDVWGRSTADGAIIQQYTPHGGNNQRWRFVEVSRGAMRIVSVHSNKCLSVPKGQQANKVGMVQQTCEHPFPSRQLWYLKRHGDAFEVHSMYSGKCLTIPLSGGRGLDNNTPIEQYTCLGATNQLVTIDTRLDSQTAFELSPASSGHCLDVPGSSTADYTTPRLYPCSGNDNQTFQFIPDGETYQVRPAHSTACLAVPREGLLVQQFRCNGRDYQQFELVFHDLGTYRIRRKNKDRCLDVGLYAIGGGTQLLTQYRCRDTSAQLWHPRL